MSVPTSAPRPKGPRPIELAVGALTLLAVPASVLMAALGSVPALLPALVCAAAAAGWLAFHINATDRPRVAGLRFYAMVLFAALATVICLSIPARAMSLVLAGAAAFVVLAPLAGYFLLMWRR